MTKTILAKEAVFESCKVASTVALFYLVHMLQRTLPGGFIAPALLIVIAIAGLAFGRDAAQNAITEQLSGLMGQQTAEVLQAAVASAASKSSGVVATIVGIITLMVTASGRLRRNADGVKCDLEG
jgi:hypothetical protein